VNWKNRQSSEANIQAAVIVAERKELIDGIFTELMSNPKLVESITSAKN